jgi:hypothetical protein
VITVLSFELATALAAWVDSVGLKQILQQAEGGDEIRAVLQVAVTRVQAGAAR